MIHVTKIENRETGWYRVDEDRKRLKVGTGVGNEWHDKEVRERVRKEHGAIRMSARKDMRRMIAMHGTFKD